MLMIRFQRIGRTNDPAFRIVVVEKERSAKTGRITEQLGTYNPRTKAVTLDEAKVKEWISKGAQPSPSLHNFLITKGVIEGKKINVLPRKTPLKPAVSETAGSGEQSAKQTVVADQKETPAEAEVVAEAVTAEEVPTADAPVA
ncbi:MAG: 30S ribosomal protein S16 [bacterium]|nr:30S ribosomal protein S16 [bacterium]